MKKVYFKSKIALHKNNGAYVLSGGPLKKRLKN